MAPRNVAQHGQSLVEMAVTLPLLLIAAIGLVQFAVYAYAENVVTGAVQDGARVATANGTSLEDGLAHAKAIMRAGLGPTAEGVAIDGREEQGTIIVTAAGSIKVMTPWVPKVALALHARASMAKERFQVGPDG